MIDISEKYFLMIEPNSSTKEIEINDELTKKVEEIMKTKKVVAMYRGFHICSCGQIGGNCDYEITIGKNKYITNILALHYIKFHRSEIPQSELKKLIN